MAELQLVSGLSCRQFINGESVEGEGHQETIVNPANGETLVSIAGQRQPRWVKQLPPRSRHFPTGHGPLPLSEQQSCCVLPMPSNGRQNIWRALKR